MVAYTDKSQKFFIRTPSSKWPRTLPARQRMNCLTLKRRVKTSPKFTANLSGPALGCITAKFSVSNGFRDLIRYLIAELNFQVEVVFFHIVLQTLGETKFNIFGIVQYKSVKFRCKLKSTRNFRIPLVEIPAIP